MELVSIASGSSGNCVYLGDDNHHILMDAGISGKRVEAGLNQLDLTAADLDGIFVTHEHSDHVSGVGVLARKHHLPIYATKGTIAAMKQSTSLGKIDADLFREITPDQAYAIGEIEVTPIRTPHDAAESVAYLAQSKGKKAGIITDLGTYDDQFIEKIKGASVLFLEANHDVRMLQTGKYPYYLKQRILGNRGHLSNENSGRLLTKLLHDHFSAVMLAHLSDENNYPHLAYETVRMEVTMGDCPYTANDFPIYVAERNQLSQRLALC